MSKTEELAKEINKANGLLTGLVLKKLDTLIDYNINLKLLSEEGKFYIGIANQLIQKGVTSVDEVSFSSVVESFGLKETYERYGGWQTVKNLKAIVDERNADSIIDTWKKWNLVKNLEEGGILNIEKHWDKIKAMNSSQMENYMTAKINDVTMNTGIDGNVEVYDLTSGYEEAINEWDKGVAIGYKLGYPILNYELCGLHKSSMSLLLAHSGNGKTSFAIPLAILPILEQGDKVMILANEQDCDTWRQMILSTVLFNKIRYRKMNRQKLMYGNFTQEDKDAMKQAYEWLGQYKGNLKFVELNDYGIDNIRRIVKKYSKMGFGTMIVDTLKPEDDSSDKAWGQFSETAKELFVLAKQNNIAMLCTAQLSTSSYGRKYLDINAIGKSRAIAEVCGQIIMFRSLQKEEKEKIKVWKHKRDEKTGKLLQTTETVKLDTDKDYICLFIVKNRYGRSNVQLVYERNMAFNTYIEIGFTEVEYDGFGR